MAFVNAPKDLGKVKTKVALNLTKRQLLCFGVAIITGLPTYILTRGVIGNSTAVLLMIGVMLPPFFIAMYEKDGQPAEKVLRNYFRSRFYWARVRPYKTENLFEILEKEGKSIANKNKTTAKAPIKKCTTSKKQSRRSEKKRTV